MDRRKALKQLAAAGALATSGMVVSRPALADGGTPSFRPTCSTAASAVSWQIVPTTATNRIILVTVTPGSHTCQPGWSASTQVRFRINGGRRMLQEGNTSNVVAPTNSQWGAFQAVTGASYSARAVNANSIDNLSNTPNLQIQVMIRRVCTKTTNPSRRAWCCTLYTRTENYNGATGWPSITSGDFGTGSTPPLDPTPCDSPAP